MMKARTFLSVVLQFLFQMILAQEGTPSFKKYAFSEGLYSRAINDLSKDRFGFVWLATEDGLIRFDGTNFKVYKHEAARAYGLRGNYISSLYSDPDGVLWMGTDGGGLGYYEHCKDSIFNFQTKHSQNNISSAITSVVGGWDGNIWVSAYGGLYIINPKTMAITTDDAYRAISEKFEGKISFSVFHDSKKRSWIGTDKGLFMYNAAFELSNVFEIDEVTEIAEDRHGRIWVGNRSGLYALTPDLSAQQHFTIVPVAALAGYAINSIAWDSDDKLWIGTNDGLFVFGHDRSQIVHYLPDDQNPNSLSSKFISSILIDSVGIYWVGTFQGGLNKYDVNSSNFKSLRCPLITSFAIQGNNVMVGTDGAGVYAYDRTSTSLSRVPMSFAGGKGKSEELVVLAMESARTGQVYIGTFDNGLIAYSADNGTHRAYTEGDTPYDLNHSSIFCLKEDRKGNIWIGTNGGGVNVLSPATGIIRKFVWDADSAADPTKPSSNYIRAIEEDEHGKIWIGTYGGGISVYDPDKSTFEFLGAGNSGLPSDYVQSIYADSKGNIWVGTGGNGVGLLSAGSQRFITLSTDEGLANGIVWKVLEDALGHIWVSTNRGISCYDPEMRVFKNYTHQDGLQPGAFTLGAGLRLPDGELFFGGQHGFNHFFPGKIRKNTRAPEVVFTELRIDNTLVMPNEDGPLDCAILLSDRIQLAYGQNFSIAFEALNYTASEKNLCEYRLEGFDQHWKRPGNDHTAHYTNLNPGNYVFSVRARNSDGVWSEQSRALAIEVAPPLWKTPAAYLLYVVFTISILLYLGQHHMKRVQMKFALDKERFIAKQQLEQERKQAAHSRQLDQLKIKFLTNLSHELRTPISLIIGSSERLISEIGDGKIMESLTLVRRNAKQVLNLVNQLLDFRKMEGQELKLALGDGEIVSFLREVCESFDDEANRRNLQYGFYVTAKQQTVLFDHGKVERILFNLLSNAFKFTPDGGVISVKMKQLDSLTRDRLLFEISVEDSGIGIAPELHEHIFVRLFHGDAGDVGLERGTGIGLSIVREFVKMHGGTVRVESGLGKGSRFTFTLALNISGALLDESPDEPTHLPHERGSHACKPLLLIVEDDDDFRFYLKDNLKNLFRVHEANNGLEGWQRARFHHPDVVVCDINMPFMNGIEFVQKMTADRRTRHIPVILLTGAGVDPVQLTGLASGAVDCMDKSFDFAVLQAKINNLLSLSKVFKDTYSKLLTVSLPEAPIVSEQEKFMLSVKRFVRENISSPQLSVEMVSQHFAMSRASLYNRLLEFAGLTPIQFIRSIKLDYAVSLLEKSEMTVSEIAYEAGFANPNYFTKVFKAHYEVTPTEFTKKKNRAKKV